jgi:hypothetical protein
VGATPEMPEAQVSARSRPHGLVLLAFATLSLGGAAPRPPSTAVITAPCDTGRVYTTADTVEKVAYATLSASDGQSPPADFLARFLDEIAANLRVPSDLTVPPTSPVLEPVWLSACRGPCSPNSAAGRGYVMRAREAPAVEGIATFVLRASGIAEIRALTDLRADPDIGPVLARTLTFVDARRRFPHLSQGVRAESLALRLHVGLAPESTSASRALFAVRLPLQLDEPVRLESSVSSTLRFRPAPGAALAGDSVVIQFVVDAMGLPVAGSAVLLAARDARFAASVLAALPQWRYAPAIVEGCRVKMQVRQPVVLRVQ